MGFRHISIQLLKIDLMGSVKISELLRPRRSPLTVLAHVSFLRKPGHGEVGAGMQQGPAPGLAKVSFWTWVLPVLRFSQTVESVHMLTWSLICPTL